MANAITTTWQQSEVTSPQLAGCVPVIVAKGLPTVHKGNRLQNLNIYLPRNSSSMQLVGQCVDSLPSLPITKIPPMWYVHIHGGAWRDPNLTAASIEATVAHAFSDPAGAIPIAGIASINYTVSPFPTHPTMPYDLRDNSNRDTAREARHPDHVRDVVNGLNLLHTLGLTDGSYVLSGHSCGACIAMQAVFVPPTHWGLTGLPEPPRPAAFIGLNGLYDLPGLVTGLNDSHKHLKDAYESIVSQAFGSAEQDWLKASVAHISLDRLSERSQEGRLPQIIVLDQSPQDQLVPMNQHERIMQHLKNVSWAPRYWRQTMLKASCCTLGGGWHDMAKRSGRVGIPCEIAPDGNRGNTHPLKLGLKTQHLLPGQPLCYLLC